MYFSAAKRKFSRYVCSKSQRASAEGPKRCMWPQSHRLQTFGLEVFTHVNLSTVREPSGNFFFFFSTTGVQTCMVRMLVWLRSGLCVVGGRSRWGSSAASFLSRSTQRLTSCATKKKKKPRQNWRMRGEGSAHTQPIVNPRGS